MSGWRAQPWTMLNFLRPRGQAKRKLRLFACGCVRRHWSRLSHIGSQRTVEAAERFADGLMSSVECLSAREEAGAAARDAERRVPSRRPGNGRSVGAHGVWNAALAAYETACGGAVRAAFGVASYIRAATRDLARISNPAASYIEEAAEAAEAAAQAALLRDLFNPFHQPPSPDPAWLAWNDGTVRKIAQAVYEECAFDRLPLLADALEDAGCTNAAILAHCREPGEHVRGCWVLDLLLGRK